MLLEKIKDIFNKYPKVIFGFSNINFSEYRHEYKCALFFAVPYTSMMTLETYNEKMFQSGIDDARKIIDKVIDELKEMLQENSVKYYVPPVAQKSEEELIAPFSFKFAAVNAGLGWIGKIN